jgi:hypothetical protein
MSWNSWIRRCRSLLSPRFTQSRRKVAPKRTRPHLECLEDRNLFATNVAASGAGIISDTAAGNSSHISMSQDGKYEVFSNTAANLVANETKDLNSSGEIFLLNRDTQQVTLISHAAGASTTTSNGNNFNPVISADGLWIAWDSTASNLITGETVPSPDPTVGPVAEVYLYNVATGATTLVSHSYTSTTTGANMPAGGANPNYAPTISQHGEYVGYLSYSTNLIANFVDTQETGSFPAGPTRNAYLYANPGVVTGSTAGTNILLSHNVYNPSNWGADGNINTITISADGTGVAYTGLSGDQVVGQTSSTDEGGVAGQQEQVFLAKESSGVTNWSSWTTYLVSHTANNYGDPYGSNNFLIDSTTEINGGGAIDVTGYADLPPVAINANGTYVAYVSAAADLTPLYPRPSGQFVNGYQVYLYSLGNGTQSLGNEQNTLVSHLASNPYYVDNSTSIIPTYYNNILVNPNAPPAPTALTPAISANGQYVAFYSDATNLGVNNGAGYNTYLFNSQASTSTQVQALTHKAVQFHLFPVSSTLPQIGTDPVMASPVTMSSNGQYIGTVGIASSEITGVTSNQAGPDALVYNTATGKFSLVSHTNGSTTATGNMFSQAPVVSNDGSTLAFLTDASNLVPAGKVDVSDVTQMFVYFNQAIGSNTAGTQYDATMRDPNLPCLTANGYSFASTLGSVSDNGNYIVFTSDARNVIPGQVDGDTGSNVFLYNRQTGTTTLVSHATVSTKQVGNATSENAVISGDGNYVAFYSMATNLVSGVTGGTGWQVYLYSVQTGGLTLLSHNFANANQASNDPSGPSTTMGSSQTAVNGELRYTPSISDDGSRIVYISGATDLVSTALSGETDGNAFLYDRTGTLGAAATNYLVSHVSGSTTTAAAVATNRSLGYPDNTSLVTISNDGSTVAFTSFGSNLVSGQTGVSGNSSTPLPNVFVYNVSTKAVSLVTHSAASNTTAVGGGVVDSNLATNADEYPASLSNNGAYIVYTSDANNLVTGETDTSGTTQVYLYTTSANTSKLVSHTPGSATTAGNATYNQSGTTGEAVISGDGSTIAFESNATNLLSGTSVSIGGSDAVYMYNVTTGAVSLVSHATNSATTPMPGEHPAISKDGQTIVYVNNAPIQNASPWGPVAIADVMEYTNSNKTVALLSAATTGPTSSNGANTYPTISSDGTHIVWNAYAQTEVAGQLDGFQDVITDGPPSNNQGTPPVITSPNSTTFIVGQNNTFQVTATGNPTPTLGETGNLPAGVTFNANTGVLSGNPTTPGVYTWTFTAQNGVLPNASQFFTLYVDQAPAITSPNSTTFIVGQNNTFTVTATGTPTPTLSETGALPNGVTFNANTGVLSGNPTAPGVWNITFTASNGINPNATQAFTLYVDQAPAITSPNSTTFIVGQNNTFTVTATGTPTPTLSETGALPNGVTFNANTGVLSGNPTVPGTFNITFTASNGINPNAVQAFTLQVNQAPAITSPNSTTFIVGQNNTFTVTATGTPTPTLSETGALPNGVTFNANTGVLSGNPTVPGTFNITFTATNGVSPDAVQAFTLQVNQAPAITSPNTTTFIVGQNNTFTVTATGTPTPTLSETGALPNGVTFNANTGVLSGNPTVPGTFNITFTATNGVSPNAVQAFTLQVNQAPAITSPNSTTFIVGQNNTFTVTATGTPTPSLSETGALPNGVTFNANTGVLSGNPTVPGTFNITFTATNGVSPDAVQAFTLYVGQAPAITSPNSTTFIVGQNNTFTVTATGTPTPTLSETGALPNGVTFNANTGVLSGNPTVPGTFNITFTASNGINPNAVQAFTLQVNQAPAITSPNSTTFIVGQNNTFTVTATGTPTPSLSETGALPNGVTFNANTGVLSGNPTVPGTFNITFTATNGVSPDAVQAFTLQVNQAPAITSPNSTTFIVGQNNTFTVTATGTPTPTLSETGALPNGVTFNANTGVLSGNPTVAGTFNITFTATNGVSPDAVQAFTLQVNQAPAITSPNSTTFIVGQNNTFTVTATGTPTPSLSETGALPNGVTFNAKTGVLSGNPTAPGTFNITFTATNGVSPNAVQAFTLQVNQAPAITSPNSTTFIVGQNNTFTVTATGTPTPSLSETGALPNGVTFNANTGVLSGNPTVAGTFNITFTATNGVSPNAVQAFTLQVNQAPAITSPNSTTFIVGQNNTFTVTATGTPTPSLSETGALPNGVTFNANTGVLSGNPTAPGTFNITFTATNGVSPDAVQAFTLQINQAPAITSPNSTTFIVGQNNTFTVTATGTPTPTLSETGALPNGVTFNANTGVLSGNPTAPGTFNITFTAANGVNPNAVQAFTLQVNQAPAITSPNNTTFIVGQNGSFTVTATGTPTPTLSETGALPNGVTFNANTGVLSGTPTVPGIFNITFTATNGVSPDAVQAFTLTVNQAPAITSPNNATFYTGKTNTFTVTATGFPAPTFKETGTLPGGISFNTTTGVLSGKPTVAGTFPITFTAMNGVNPNATQNFTLTVLTGIAPAITSANNTVFVAGQANSFQVTATGTPTPTLSETGALPNGVTFNAATGVLSGDPTVGGTFIITFTANNGVGSAATQRFTLTVYQAPYFTSASTLEVTQGTTFSLPITAGGYTAPGISEQGALPAGVVYAAASKTLSGKPVNPGTYIFTFTASNGIFPNATQLFLLTVDPTTGPVNPTLTATLVKQDTWINNAMAGYGQGIRSIQPLVSSFSSTLTNEYNSVIAQQTAFMNALSAGLSNSGNINNVANLFNQLEPQEHNVLASELQLLQDVAAAYPNVDQTAIIAAENNIINLLATG